MLLNDHVIALSRIALHIFLRIPNANGKFSNDVSFSSLLDDECMAKFQILAQPRQNTIIFLFVFFFKRGLLSLLLSVIVLDYGMQLIRIRKS